MIISHLHQQQRSYAPEVPKSATTLLMPFVVRYKTGVSEGALALHYLTYFVLVLFNFSEVGNF